MAKLSKEGLTQAKEARKYIWNSMAAPSRNLTTEQTKTLQKDFLNARRHVLIIVAKDTIKDLKKG